ncbi:hypothetical protein [Comamonas sp. 4034]|uniref:hypothetical protein n=1 Tax=Comamonas sp. 4034 TaxID=3156455 RepID=UPI003D2122E1
MTDKTEAQPEALRLAQFFESLTESSHRWWDGVPVHEKAATVLRAQSAEIEQLKAQLSARQAVPDGWRLAPFKPTPEMINAGVAARRSGGTSDEVYMAMLSAAPPPPEREPLSNDQWQALADALDRIINRELKNKISTILQLPTE